MSGYVKLFSSLLDSTVWYTPPAVKVVWVTMLAMADRDGIVEASVPGLANRAGVTREEVETALFTFLSPDPDSRTKEHEGRRIEVIDGGWKLLNYEKYRDKWSLEEKREKDAERQRRKRERDASKKVTPVTKSRLSSHLISSASQHTESVPEPSVPPESEVQIKVHEGPQGRLPETIWQELWEVRYGRKLVWSMNTGRNGEVSLLHALWRQAEASAPHAPEIRFRHWIIRYLGDDDPWMSERSHPVIGITTRINQYEPGKKPERAKAPPSHREFPPEPESGSRSTPAQMAELAAKVAGIGRR